MNSTPMIKTREFEADALNALYDEITKIYPVYLTIQLTIKEHIKEAEETKNAILKERYPD